MAVADIVGSLSLSGENAREISDAVVCLEDTTEADAASVVLARAECRPGPAGARTVRFRLSVPDHLLAEGRQYSLSARAKVESGARSKVFGTVQSYPVDHRGAGITDLELREMD